MLDHGLNERTEMLYRLVLKFDELYRRCRDLDEAWDEEPAEHKLSISITLFSAVMGVLEAYRQIAGDGASPL
jgi:hypothetical protein